MIRIRDVKPLNRFRVRVELSNGRKKTIDLEPFLHGPIFEPLRRNLKLFRTMKVDAQLGTIVWENGSDIDPDVLIGKYIPEWMEEQPKKSYTPSRSLKHIVAESKTRYKAKKKK